METVFVNLITLAEPPAEINIIELLKQATPVVKGVMGVLILMALIAGYVMVYKWLMLRRAQQQLDQFSEIFWKSKRLDEIYHASEHLLFSPTSQIFRAGYVELSKLKGGQGERETMHGQMGELENVDRALRRAHTAELVQLEGLISILATTGSAAPFIGLFGTVWGIMSAFLNIGKQGDASLVTVAPGIAEALIATAIGLVAAIPAVIAYNYFLNRLRVIEAHMENFSSDFLNIIKRHFFK
ncbi:protein TolQ [Myxococcota bacterium]|nr:protein TolQ [Myxococcota bacterium]